MIHCYLYHGSTNSGIEVLEPRKRYVPAHDEDSPACIYATPDPAFAAAHAFPWSSSEGIDLYYDDVDGTSRVFLEVPSTVFSRLNQPISIYTLNSQGFVWVKEEVVGKTYRSIASVKSLAEQRFDTVIDAVQYFGGVVRELS